MSAIINGGALWLLLKQDENMKLNDKQKHDLATHFFNVDHGQQVLDLIESITVSGLLELLSILIDDKNNSIPSKDYIQVDIYRELKATIQKIDYILAKP